MELREEGKKKTCVQSKMMDGKEPMTLFFLPIKARAVRDLRLVGVGGANTNRRRAVTYCHT